MSTANYKIAFVIDGRPVKNTTSDFKDLEKALNKTGVSFSNMEKLMGLQLLSSAKLAGSMKNITGLTKQIAPPLLDMGGILRTINELEKQRLTTGRRTKATATLILKEAANLKPELLELIALQDRYYESLLKSSNVKKEDKKIALGLTKKELTSGTGTFKLMSRGLRRIGETWPGGLVSRLFKTNVWGKAAQGTDKLGKGWDKMAKMAKTAALGAGVFLGALVAFGSASPLLQAQMSYMNFQMEQMGIIVGDSLVPLFQLFSDGLQVILDIWNSLSPEMQAAIQDLILLATVVAAATIAFTLLDLAMSPVTLVILAIAAALLLLFYAWETNFMGMKDIGLSFVADIMGAFDTLLSGLEKLFSGDLSGIVDIFLGAWDLIMQAVFGFPAAILKIAGNVIDNITGGIFKPLLNLFGGIGKIIEGIVTLNLDKLNEGWAEIQAVFNTKSSSSGSTYNPEVSRMTRAASGGIVPGGISSKDSVGMLLAPGEMVLNRGQQSNLFSLLNGSGGTSIVNNANRSANYSITVNVNGSGSGYDLGSGSGSEILRGMRRQGGLFT
jgi:hypothetical protein